MSGEMQKIYDLCIIGAGMIGSAAARHSFLVSPDITVCLIGPSEPKNYADGIFFGEHYDDGRITRQAASDYVWSVLAVRSIERYRKLEQIAGIPFYTERGYAILGPDTSPMIMSLNSVAQKLNIPLRKLTQEEFGARFPYINNRQNHMCELEEYNAGYINPRKLIEAEQKVAISKGCELVQDIANSASEIELDGGQTIVRVELASGHVIHANKVLLATGASTGFRRLLPSGIMPTIYLHKQVVTFAEITDDDAQGLSNMPPLSWDAYSMHEIPNSPDPVENDSLFLLPPIRYPDGKYYIKIGHGRRFEVQCHTEAEVKDAFCNKVSEEIEKAQIAWLNDIFPDVTPVSFHSKCCVLSLTSTYRPFIDLATSRVAVAIGGNGYAAKSCDEIGRLAVSLLLTGCWNDDLPHDVFKLSADKPMTQFVKKLA